MRFAETETEAGELAIDPEVGNIRTLNFFADGRILAPLHTAPWVSEPDTAFDEETPPVERKLSGDFFCAPFGASDDPEIPAHGWTANSAWERRDAPAGSLAFKLMRGVRGAMITKEATLASNAPILYQTHVLEGGEGAMTVAHHPMTRLAERGWLSVSPKRLALTPEVPLEPGRNVLTCAKRIRDLRSCPGVGGGTIDATDLPIGSGAEDFITLVEAPGSRLGWTAVVREREDDIVFVLKNPSTLPITMFWHSNGGRDRVPWNGRHAGVLGIEDGCAAGAGGYRAALQPNDVSSLGVPTALSLGGRLRIAHVIGAIPRPEGWTRIARIEAATGRLTLTEAGAGSVSLPFDDKFLNGG